MPIVKEQLDIQDVLTRLPKKKRGEDHPTSPARQIKSTHSSTRVAEAEAGPSMIGGKDSTTWNVVTLDDIIGYVPPR